MQVKKTEIIEVEKAETKFGTFHEWKNGLAVSFKTPSELSITLFKDELRIRIPVIRSGHDHNDEATITIKGLKFITNERERYPPLKQGQEIIPTIIFGERYIPKFDNPKRLRWWLMNDLSKQVGKQFGYAKKDLVIHAHTVDDTNKDCLTIIGSKDALERLYSLIDFKEKK